MPWKKDLVAMIYTVIYIVVMMEVVTACAS
jgi:hypothetical protein